MENGSEFYTEFLTEKRMEKNLSILIKKGGVFYGVEGSTPDKIFKSVTEQMDLPVKSDADVIYNALCAREAIMTTAVGNGIALPHARTQVIKNEEDQRVCVVYLKEPIDMKAPDNIKVFVMFIILTQNPQTHLQTLSSLVSLFKNAEFRKLLESHASEEDLLSAIERMD